MFFFYFDFTSSQVTTSSPTSYPTPSYTSGSSGYTRYYSGNGPIIFLANHGGYDEPLNWDEREDGCYTANGDPDCDWTSHNCNGGSSSCDAGLLRDSFTQEIALCLLSRTTFISNNIEFTPHLISNQLHRKFLDSNRQQEEAAQGDTRNDGVPLDAWNEIHEDSSLNGFVYQAKESADENCGFGLLFDIHGQAQNDYTQFGYRLRPWDYDVTDAAMNNNDDNRKRSSIGGLVSNNNIADIIRGPNSLGTLLENKLTGNNGNGNNYLVIPSSTYPDRESTGSGNSFSLFTGGFSVKYHGSSVWNTVDDGDGLYYTPNDKSNLNIEAVQIEIPSDIRKNENGADRNQFCIDLSEVIVDFVEYWYDTSSCTLS